jgi:ion channel
VRLYFRRFWSSIKINKSRCLVMVGIVGIMMGTHCIEVCIWAIFYFLRGLIPSWLSAVYFSIASYTTLGESDVALPQHWRGLGSFESMCAMLMYGWSTAMLAAMVMKMHSIDE